MGAIREESVIIQDARAAERLVRDIVARAPIACNPEALIFAETCASALSAATFNALRSSGREEEVTRLRVAEAIALELGLHTLEMHEDGIVGGALFDALTSVTCRLRSELRRLGSDARGRLLRVA